MSNLEINFNTIASGNVHQSLVTVTIDTVTAVTLSKVPDDVFEELVEQGRKVTFRDGHYIRQPWLKNQRIWFKRLEDGRVMFSGSPSRCRTIQQFLELVEDLLGKWALKAKITRLDCTITLPLPFKDVFTGMDFGKRRSCERYKANQKGNTFYIGRVGRRYEILIYDKRKERNSKSSDPSQQINHPCTRIEINSIPKKGMKVRELSLIRNHRPFKDIKWYRVHLIEPSKCTRAVLKRFVEFQTLLNQDGFFRTKRLLRMRTNRNFERLYGGFYRLEEIRPTLDEIFQHGIEGMFRH